MYDSTQVRVKTIISGLRSNSEKLQTSFSDLSSGTALSPQNMASLVELNARAWASEEILRVLDYLPILNSATVEKEDIIDAVNLLMVLCDDWAGRRGTSPTSLWVISETINDLNDIKDLYK